MSGYLWASKAKWSLPQRMPVLLNNVTLYIGLVIRTDFRKSQNNNGMVTLLSHNDVSRYNRNAMAGTGEINDVFIQHSPLVSTIIDLHEKGYTDDFMLVGKRLLWMQEKIYISASDFSILECFRFDNPDQPNKVLFISGVIAAAENVRGILMFHHDRNTKIPGS